MLIPQKDRRQILSYLFKEGVCVAEKNIHPTAKHAEIAVLNLYVLALMKSLKSRGFVTSGFNWNHHYFFLTNEGIEFLREELNLPEHIVPATLNRRAARPSNRGPRPGGDAAGAADGKDVAPAEGEFKPTFEGGRGRGRGGFRGGRGMGRGRGGRAGYQRDQPAGETPQE